DLYNGGSISNTAAGLINSGSYGISVNAGALTLTNAGTITGSSYGIALSGTGNSTVVNAGTIVGTQAAIKFSSGNDLLAVVPAAVFVGKVDGGTGSNTLELASAASAGTITAIGTSFKNFGTIAVDAGAQWTITGSNTVASGTTYTDSGTLQVDGTIGNTTVQSGGILDGTGTTGALTVESGGTLAPGNSPGTITTGDLDLQAGATLLTEIQGTSPGVGGFDQVVVNGSVTLG